MKADLEKLSARITGEGGDAAVRASATEAALAARLEADGWEAVRVDRAPVFDRATLLHALYQACRFPAWFGFNWDALLDALAEPPPAPARGRALVFAGLDLLEEREPETARTFLEVVADARARGAAVRVVRLGR
ncbi:MAG: barstar family protein [Anaeromyxobacter sp.]